MRPLAIMNINSYFDEIYTEDYLDQTHQRNAWRLFGRIPLISSLYSMEQYLLAKRGTSFTPYYPVNFVSFISNLGNILSLYTDAGLFIDREGLNEISDDDYILNPDYYDKLVNIREAVLPLFDTINEEGIPSYYYLFYYKVYEIYYKHFLESDGSYSNLFNRHEDEVSDDGRLITLLDYSKKNADDYYYLPDEVEKYIDREWKNLPNSFESGDHDIDLILDIDYGNIESYPILSGARRGYFAPNLDSDISNSNNYVLNGFHISFDNNNEGLLPKLSSGLLHYNSMTYYFGGISGDVRRYVGAPTEINILPFSDIFVYESKVLLSSAISIDDIDDIYDYERAPFGGGFSILPTYDYNESQYGYETVQDKGEFICSGLPLKRSYTIVDYDKIVLNGVYPSSSRKLYIHAVNYLDEDVTAILYNDAFIPYEEVYLSIFNVMSKNYEIETSYSVNFVGLNDETLSDIAEHWYILEIYDSETGFPLTAEIEPNGDFVFISRNGQTTDDTKFLTNEYGIIIFGCDDSVDLSTNININIIGE